MLTFCTTNDTYFVHLFYFINFYTNNICKIKIPTFNYDLYLIYYWKSLPITLVVDN